MAEGLVVGIFPQSDPKALESALSAAQVDLSKIKVVTIGAADDDAEESEIEFVDVIEELEDESRADEITRGTGIMSDSGGTSVPGISGGRQVTLDSFRHRDDPARRYLAGYAIPDDEVDNFGDAVAEGRAVVIYSQPGADAQQIADAFRAAGLKNVRAY